jgi:hypothetical protein
MGEVKPEVAGTIEPLECLVEEMLKDEPKEETIKEQMKLIGIPYSSDPIERLNAVLFALHPNRRHFESN